MSEISVNSILDASGGATTTINGFTPTVSNMAGRNRLINSDMRIDQRNAGASVTPSNGQYSADRWFAFLSAASKFSIQQNSGAVTPPTRFSNYLGAVSLSAYSVGTTESFGIAQNIEGFNSADFAWGTASAVSATLSFWVRSSLTGIFGGSLRNDNADRSYPFSYTISAANTWEQKSVTIAGPTSGSFVTNNGLGIRLAFSLGAGTDRSGTAGAWNTNNNVSATGATSVVGTSGATLYITGVQLEVGSVATPFEHRMYGQELALCQRYFKYMPAMQGNFIIGGGNVFVAGAADTAVNMRATPTATLLSGSDAIHVSNLANYSISSISYVNENYYRFNTTSGAGSGAPGHLNIGSLTLTAEL